MSASSQRLFWIMALGFDDDCGRECLTEAAAKTSENHFRQASAITKAASTPPNNTTSASFPEFE